MKEQFVPYELALKLKKLGFDEKCFGAYNESNNNKFMIAPQLSSYEINTGKNSDKTNINVVTAPLWQQAFDWFRDRKLLEGLILPQQQSALTPLPLYFFAIESYVESKWNELFNTTNKETLLHYSSYEEARQACLEKLIEFIKNKERL